MQLAEEHRGEPAQLEIVSDGATGLARTEVLLDHLAPALPVGLAERWNLRVHSGAHRHLQQGQQSPIALRGATRLIAIPRENRR